MRILYVSNPTMQSPYLSSHAANLAWLPDAFRDRGHDVTVRLAADPFKEAAKARDEGFDYISVHESGATHHRAGADGRVLQTAYCRRVPPVNGQWVALSAMQSESTERPPAGVIPPALQTDTCDYSAGRDESLAFAFDGHDVSALRAAISVARNTERPLNIVVSAALPLAPEAELEIARAARFAQVERMGRDEFPEALATSAAYLSFHRGAFDMAALTAMACGTPVLTLHGISGEEIIVHGESGFASESAKASARAIDWLGMLAPRHSRERARVVYDAGAAAMGYEALWEAMARGVQPRPMDRRRVDAEEAPSMAPVSSAAR